MPFSLKPVANALSKIREIEDPAAFIDLHACEENRSSAEKAADVVESVIGLRPVVPTFRSVVDYAQDHFERNDRDNRQFPEFEEDLAALPNTAEHLLAMLENPLLNDDCRVGLVDAAGAWVLFYADMISDAFEVRRHLEAEDNCTLFENA